MTLNIGVTDEQIGKFHKRVRAIETRLGKSLDFESVMNELQRIHDKKTLFNPSTLTSQKGLWLSENFCKRILSVAKETPRVSLNLSSFVLKEEDGRTDAEIRARLGENHVFGASELCLHLSKKLAPPKDGDPLWELYYVEGINEKGVSVVFAVDVWWYDGVQLWLVRAHSLDDYRWSAGIRAFYRKPLAK